MKVYAFDVDETLEVSDGPIKLEELQKLSAEGHIVGLCGNWARLTLFDQLATWSTYINFLGPMEMSKQNFLMQLRDFIPAEDHIMVGNIKGVTGRSDDQGAANLARWRFLTEREFADGAR